MRRDSRSKVFTVSGSQQRWRADPVTIGRAGVLARGTAPAAAALPKLLPSSCRPSVIAG